MYSNFLPWVNRITALVRAPRLLASRSIFRSSCLLATSLVDVTESSHKKCWLQGGATGQFLPITLKYS